MPWAARPPLAPSLGHGHLGRASRDARRPPSQVHWPRGVRLFGWYDARVRGGAHTRPAHGSDGADERVSPRISLQRVRARPPVRPTVHGTPSSAHAHALLTLLTRDHQHSAGQSSPTTTPNPPAATRPHTTPRVPRVLRVPLLRFLLMREATRRRYGESTRACSPTRTRRRCFTWRAGAAGSLPLPSLPTPNYETALAVGVRRAMLNCSARTLKRGHVAQPHVAVNGIHAPCFPTRVQQWREGRAADE